MRAIPFSMMGIFAHPDDEIGIGSTLACYGEAGVLTLLACASRGEAATIYCDDCASRETLADVRTHEMECARRNLGVAELRWLDWPDGGIANVPRTKAVATIVGLIRELQPDVVITHPEHGLYPHPDHLAMWEIVREAYDAAANPDRFPAAGPAWAAGRLFTTAIRQSFYEAAPGFAAARVELNGQLLPYYATPDEQIDTTMQVVPWVPRRTAAWECHRSQHNPDSALARLPDGMRQTWAGNEDFVLAAARLPLPDGAHDDLLAGLDRSPAEEAALLAVALAARKAYQRIYEVYQQSAAKDAPLRRLLEQVAEREHEFLYLLASALRRADGVPAAVEPDPHLLAQARGCSSITAQERFLQVSARHAVLWYEHQAARAEGGEDGEQAQPWGELLVLARDGQRMVDEYLA